MKTKISLIISLTIIMLMAYGKKPSFETTIQVSGNCEHCEMRIEKAAKLPGVKKVSWSQEHQNLTIAYDSTIVALDDIEKSIAAAGHDTAHHKAESSVYATLPPCCQYRP